MKIGEASKIYSAKLSEINEQRKALYEKKKALEDGRIEMTDDEVKALGKAIDRIEIKRDNASKAMESVNTQKSFLMEAENSKRQGDAMAEQAENYSKCLEVAHRIAKGDKVPLKDEQKLLEFSSEMYQMAKNMAAVANNEKVKKHKTLWKDEDEARQPEKSVEETVDNMECSVDPIVDSISGGEISVDIDTGSGEF